MEQGPGLAAHGLDSAGLEIRWQACVIRHQGGRQAPGGVLAEGALDHAVLIWEVVECGLPALFTAARGLNLPRYPSLQGIMRAKKEEVKYLDINSLGMDPEDLSETIKVEKLYYPLRSRRNIMPGGDIKEQVEKAVKFLKEEVKVI